MAKDQVEAVKWYRKAAEHNDAEAQYNLGICYERGEGVAEDWVEVYKWLLLAARQGVEAPKEHMTLLENSCSVRSRLHRDKSGRASLAHARVRSRTSSIGLILHKFAIGTWPSRQHVRRMQEQEGDRCAHSQSDLSHGIGNIKTALLRGGWRL